MCQLRHQNHGAAVLDTFKQVVNSGRELRLQVLQFIQYKLLSSWDLNQVLIHYRALIIIDWNLECPSTQVSWNWLAIRFCRKNWRNCTVILMLWNSIQVIHNRVNQWIDHLIKFALTPPGLLLEKTEESVTPFTMVNIGGPYAIKGMMANPISSPQYWKPSTFGGEVGFNIVKTATVRGLFCRNMKGQCGHIAFKLPDHRSPQEKTTLEPSIRQTAWQAGMTSVDHPPSTTTTIAQHSPQAGMTNTQCYNCNYRSVKAAVASHLDFIDCQQLHDKTFIDQLTASGDNFCVHHPGDWHIVKSSLGFNF